MALSASTGGKILLSRPRMELKVGLWVLALVSLLAYCASANEPYWSDMFPVNSNYMTDGINQEVPSAAYNTNPDELAAVVVWSSRGNPLIKSRLTARTLARAPGDWYWQLEDSDDIANFEKAIFTPLGFGAATYESAVACDQTKTWVIVFSDGYDIRFVRSTDNARTWSAHQLLDPLATGAMNRNPHVLFDNRTGMWYASWISGSSEGEAGDDLDVAFSRSSDGGATWSSSIWVNPTATADEEDESNVRLVYGKNDTDPLVPCVHVLYYSNNPHGIPDAGNDGDIFISTTCDEGLTFGSTRLLNPSTMGDAGNTQSEVSFDVSANINGENVVVVYRAVPTNGSKVHEVRATQSSDGGWNFDTPVVIHSVALDTQVITPPSVHTDSRGLFICAFGSRKAISRTSTSDYYDEPYKETIDTQADVDVFYSIASTKPHGIPGTGWSRPHVPDENNAVVANADTDRPVLLTDGGENWVMILMTNQQYLFRWTSRDTGTDVDVMFIHFDDMEEEMYHHNGIGLTSYSAKALQEKINSLPTNMPDEVTLAVARNIYFGGETVQEAEARSVVISGGRKIRLVRPVKHAWTNLYLWGNHRCAFPYFVIADLQSGIRLDAMDEGFWDIQTSYLVRNDANSDHLFFQVKEDHGYHICNTNMNEHSPCPLGFRPPEPADGLTYYPKYCVPCPAGRECGDHSTFNTSASPTVVCPPGRFCPLGTFNSKYTKCDVLRVYSASDTGFASRDECLSAGRPCEFGFWCAPGTLENEYVQILENDTIPGFTHTQLTEGLVLDETLVYPSPKRYRFPFKRTREEPRAITYAGSPSNQCFAPRDSCDHSASCMDIFGRCGQGFICEPNYAAMTPEGTGCKRSVQIRLDPTVTPQWLDMWFLKNDVEQDDYMLHEPTETAEGALEIYSQALGVPISEKLSFGFSLQFFSLWDTYPFIKDVMVPLRVNITRSVTTVIFNPADRITTKARFDSGNFTTNATMFNIGCDDSLDWSAQMWDCSSPDAIGLNPFDLDVSAFPVDWIETEAPFNSGFIGIGVTDPAVVVMRVFPQRVNPLVASQVLGLLNYRACLRVQFIMSSDPTTVLKKDLDVILSTFQECSQGTFSDLGTSENGPCSLCEAGSYADTEGATICKSCPESFPRSVAGATSVSQCKAAPGYFRDVDNSSISCSTLGPGVSCLNEGLTLETVDLLPGYWRSDPRSKHILRCPNRGYCVGGVHRFPNSTATNNSRRRILLVDETDESYCLLHHRGPYCQVCEPGYVKRGMAPCTFCDAGAYAADQQRLGWTILAAAVIVIVAFLVTQRQRFKLFARRRAESIMALGKKVNARGSIASALLHESSTGGGEAQQQQQPAAPVMKQQQDDDEQQRRSRSQDEQQDTRAQSKESVTGNNNNRQLVVKDPLLKRSTITAGRSTREFARSMSRRLRPISNKLDKHTSFLWSIIVGIEASTTLRILVSLFQVIGGISKNFDEVYPEIFQTIASAFNALSAEIFYNIDFACVVHTNHYLSLILGLVSPLIAMGIILVVHFVFERRLRNHHRLVDIPKLRSGTYSLFLVLLFLIYPSVSSTILSSFVCRSFDDGSKWLRKDITINCEASDRGGWIALASVGVMVYVIGIPVCYLWSLVRVRHEINPKDQKQVPDKRKFASVLFLTEIYKRKYWYWEVVELVRKLVQTSLIIFFLDGSVMQMIVMIAVAMIMVQTINEIKPYVNEGANKLASIAQWEILIVAFIGLLLKVDLQVLDSSFNYNKQDMLTICLVTACFMAPAFALFQQRRFVYNFIVKQRCGFKTMCGLRKGTKTDDDSDEYEVIPFSSVSTVDFIGKGRATSSGGMYVGTAGGGMMENPIVQVETSKATSSASKTRAAFSSSSMMSNGGGDVATRQERMVSFSPSVGDDNNAGDVEEKRHD